MMPELIVNLHMHTTYSDGTGDHQNIAQAALKTELDAVIVTDHNVLVEGPEGYYQEGDQQILMLIGEEVHDRTREPQKNHLLVIGVDQEMVGLAEKPQELISAVSKAGGLSFLAHPTDPAAPLFDQEDISWVDWSVEGFTGLELWNGFSEFKRHLKNKFQAIFYAYQPDRIAEGPFPETLRKWDQLTSSGKRVVAVGGSDAHALHANLGPLRRTLFPYKFHFQGINTHLITPEALSGDLDHDRRLVLDSLRAGRAFIGYDLPASTRGFRFYASRKNHTAIMGDEISAEDGVTLQANLPLQAYCRLIKDGIPLREWDNRAIISYITTQSGVYRIEAYLDYKGKQRGWIFSNPIYVRN